MKPRLRFRDRPCLIAFTVLLSLVTLGCAKRRRSGAETDAGQTRQVIAVDWLGRGQVYAARIIGEQEGLIGVMYADGDREWVTEDRIRDWPELVGTRVLVWIQHQPTPVTIGEQRGALYRVEFDDHTYTWVSEDMLYQLSAPPEAAAPPSPVEVPERPAADPSGVEVGSLVLCAWVVRELPQRGQAWLAEIVGRDGADFQIRFLADGSSGTIRERDIFRVFGSMTSADGLVAGDRVWLRHSTPLGTIIERRGEFVRVESAGTEQWLEVERVLALWEPIDLASIDTGSNITVLWTGGTLYHATVLERSSSTARVAWHEGSPPSEIELGSIVEIWGIDPTMAD